MKIKEIFTGWTNLLKKGLGIEARKIEKLSKERLAICNSCDIRSGRKCDPKKFGKNIITGKMTKGCGCNIDAKTRSPKSTCPLGKW